MTEEERTPQPLPHSDPDTPPAIPPQAPKPPRAKTQSPLAKVAMAAVLLALLALLSYAVWIRVRSPFPSGMGPTHPAVGRKFTTLDLERLTGNPPRIRSVEELKGRVVLINFWAFDCPPCRQEFPELLKLREEFENEEDFELISVASGLRPVTTARLLVETKAFLAAQKTELPTYHDQSTTNRRALIDSAGLASFGLPATVLLDRDGVIRALWLGYTRGVEKQMESEIRRQLAQ